MTGPFRVTRRIEIDAGHRIATHGSKCRNLHGHRYAIEATCTAGGLKDQGEETGMVMDFAFLKEEMRAVIDADCDHGFIAALDDTDFLQVMVPDGMEEDAFFTKLRATVERQGYAVCHADNGFGKLYVVPFQPTAECLARHWFERLAPRIARRSEQKAALVKIRVFETPNCFADYCPES